VATTMSKTVASGVHADGMGNQQRPAPEVPERPRPRSYSARYKAEVLDEYERLDKAGKGALLRREGLYTSLISEWRKQRDRGALAALARPQGRPPATRWSGTTPGCAGRTSVWPANLRRPAR
jgi:hypothetical protein